MCVVWFERVWWVGRNLQVNNPRARLPFRRVERKEVRKVALSLLLSSASTSALFCCMGGAAYWGFSLPQTGSHCRSGDT